MLRWVLQSSLKFRALVLALGAIALVVGVMQARSTPVEALPEFSPPTVEVQTEALGLSAAEVEQLITVPLEQDLLVGVPFLKDIESVSLPGLSSVVMTFQPGTDLLDARQVVQERLTQAVGIAGLPAVANTPQMMQPHSSSSRAAIVKLSSTELTPIEMSVLARWVVGPRLLGVDGVANVSIWGNRERQLQVLVDPEQLRRDGVTLQQVIRTAGNSLEVSPLPYLEASKPGTGGFIDTPNQRLNIFHEQAITTPEELAEVPLEGPAPGVSPGSGPAVLGDVATVVEDHQPLIGDAVCPEETCLLLVVEKFPGTTSADVSDGLVTAFDALAPGLTGVEIDTSVYRPASYVESATDRLALALLVGGALLVLLLVALLRDWRRTAVVVGGTVMSGAATVLVLQGLGVTVNLMIVAGVFLGLTALVDDAVQDVEAMARRVGRLRASGSSQPAWPVLLDALNGARRSAFAAALIVAAVTVPLLFLPDEGGAFLPPLLLAYLLAVATSMLVALTVTPALGLTLLARAPREQGQSPAVARMQSAFDSLMTRTTGLNGRLMAAFGVLLLIGLGTIPFLKLSLSPELQERDLVVNVAAEPGTSLPLMTELTRQTVTEIGALPGVRSAHGQIGRAVMSDQSVDVHRGQVWVNLDGSTDYDDTLASIRETAAAQDGLDTEVRTYSRDRVAQVLGRDADDLVLRVYGEDPDVLNAKAAELRDAISGVDGVTAAEVAATPEESTIEVEVDLDAALQERLKPGDVRRAASILIGGITVGNLFEEQKVFDVVVWGDPAIRQTQADVDDLLIDSPGGGSVRLADVADVRTVTSPSVIRHESVARYVQVSAQVSGRDIAAVADDVTAAVKTVSFPRDHHAELLTGFEDRSAGTTQLITIGLAALVAIILVLQAAFRSWRLAGLALVALPTAVTGGLLVTLVTGGDITLGTLAGLVVAVGLAARGLVAMVHHLLMLQRDQRMPVDAALAQRAASERLVPTLLTLLGAAAVLLPLAVLGRGPGLEILQPAAVTLLGALVTIALVTLVAAPMAFLRLAPEIDVDGWVDGLLDPAPARAGEVVGREAP